MRQYMGEHRCQGCGSAFYENDILEFAGKWYHKECFESAVAGTFLAYEDGGEWAIMHHKNRQWWHSALKDYINKYSGSNADVVRLYGVVFG